MVPDVSFYSQIWISTDFNKASNSKFRRPDRLVGGATRYARNGPGIESRWVGGGQIFLKAPDMPSGPTSLLHNG